MALKLKVGLIGCGEIGQMRAAALARTPTLELAVVCDVVPERAEKLAAQYGCKASSNWQEVVAQPDLAVIIVSTSNDLHAPISLAAMEQGKHVLCEKPLARTTAEGQAMVAAAERYNVRFKTGFNHRYYPSVMKARELIDRGEIGQIMYVRSYIGHPGGEDFTRRWMCQADISGGGSLLDNGIHVLDLTRYFLGEEITQAQGYRATLGWPVAPCEDNAFALYRTDGGRIASVQSSWTEWKGYQFRVEVYGTLGYVEAAYPPMRTILGRVDRVTGKTRKRYFLFPLFQIKERLKSYRWTTEETFVKEHLDFSQAIRDEREPFSSGRDGLRAVELAQAVYQSSETNRPVSLVEGE